MVDLHGYELSISRIQDRRIMSDRPEEPLDCIFNWFVRETWSAAFCSYSGTRYPIVLHLRGDAGLLTRIG